MEQTDQANTIQALTVMIDYMIQYINLLKETDGSLEKTVKTLQEQNNVLQENMKQYDKNIVQLKNFVGICRHQLPKLLTRLVIDTQSEDLRLCMDQSVQALSNPEYVWIKVQM